MMFYYSTKKKTPNPQADQSKDRDNRTKSRIHELPFILCFYLLPYFFPCMNDAQGLGLLFRQEKKGKSHWDKNRPCHGLCFSFGKWAALTACGAFTQSSLRQKPDSC